MPDSYFQVPPNSTGAKIATKTYVKGADTVHVQYIDQDEERTFLAWALSVAPGNLKSMLSLMNTNATEVVEIQEIYLNNSALAAVTGVLHDFRLFRITGHSGGTALTNKPLDTSDSLPSGISSATGATVSGEETTPLDRWVIQGDEIKVSTLDGPGMDNIMSNHFTKWAMSQRKAKSILLRQNQGITIKEMINTTVGSFDVGVLYTLKNQ
jgi:hypothetical protein